MKKTYILLIALALNISISYAESASHSHGDRNHSHPLPNQGIKHQHGNGRIGSYSVKSTNIQQKTSTDEANINYQYTNNSKASELDKFDDDLLSFLQEYNIKELVKFSKTGNGILIEWYPDENNKFKHGVNGVGYIRFPRESGHKIVKVYGDFVNGILNGKGVLEVDRYVATNWTSKHYIDKTVITPSSNLKKLIINGFQSLEPQAQAEIKRLLSLKSSTSYTVSDHTPCHSDEQCFDIIEKESDSFKIRCTKGSFTGNTHTICVDKDGDWSYGCTLGSYHYSSSTIAGNKYCE